MDIRDTLSKPAYGIPDLLDIVPMSRSWIYSEIEDGKLRVTKVGRRTIFLVDDVADWLSGLREASPDQLDHNGGSPLNDAAKQSDPPVIKVRRKSEETETENRS
jgi:hypothetical protein